MSTTHKRLAFIGGGNMAASIIGGLVNSGYPPSLITVFEPVPAAAQSLQSRFSILLAPSNDAAVLGTGIPTGGGPADVVLICVKPQVMQTVARGLARAVQHVRPLVISIAAGIRSSDLERWLAVGAPADAPRAAIVRVMPNTPALLLEGASGMHANAAVTAPQRELAASLVRSVSRAVEWVESEHLVDVTTGLSGSGPAYFFLLIEALENAAVGLGMQRSAARALAAQTCLGAGKMALEEIAKGEEGVDVAELRRRVTSPGGTTAAGIKVLEESGFRGIVEGCVKAATERGAEMGELFGKDVEPSAL